MDISVHHYLTLSAMLFTIGAYGVFTRRNLIVVLMSLELMLNSVNISFVTFARIFENVVGHVFMIMSITVAAAEVAVGLAFVVLIYNRTKSLDIDVLRLLKG